MTKAEEWARSHSACYRIRDEYITVGEAALNELVEDRDQLRALLDAAQKAITEMRQRIANCHDRLLRGDTDPELLKLLEGNWGPPSGLGITEEKT